MSSKPVALHLSCHMAFVIDAGQSEHIGKLMIASATAPCNVRIKPLIMNGSSWFQVLISGDIENVGRFINENMKQAKDNTADNMRQEWNAARFEKRMSYNRHRDVPNAPTNPKGWDHVDTSVNDPSTPDVW